MTQEQRNENLAKDLRTWLIAHEMWVDVVIYFNGKAYATSDGKQSFYNDKDHLIEYEADPENCLEYFNKETVTMSFEGPLYHLLNYESYRHEYKEFSDIFKKYGLYFEFGYAWSLSAYEL